MSKASFNFISFEKGLQRIASARKRLGLEERATKIVTSRDLEAEKLVEQLQVSKLPIGFQKWQLPVAISETGAQFFMSVAQAGSAVEEHSHEEGDGLRVIVSGSIMYDGKELVAGDWMFIPAKAAYSFKVGRHGATMFYCYACCCVPV